MMIDDDLLMGGDESVDDEVLGDEDEVDEVDDFVAPPEEDDML